MLQFAIPVKLRVLGHLAWAFVVVALGLVVMWLVCGPVGAVVLLAVVVVLSRLLLRVARGE